jgi:two-component system, OmpR family, sensor kinase
VNPSRWTLRRRLVVAIVALLAVVSIAIGTVSVLTLRSFLIGRLDSQLTSATGRSQQAIHGGQQNPDGRPPASGYLALPGQQEGTLGAIISGGRIFSGAVLDANGDPTPLSLRQAQLLADVPADAVPRTVDLGSTLNEYRVVVVQSEGDDRLLIGLPMSGVNATVLQLIWVIAIVTAAGLVAIGGAGAFTVRLALRPLKRVVATATRVSELPLERGDVALAERVPDADADPNTEVGQVGGAINKMLGHIAAALAARQASEKKVRNFVADASHELRTPLASIRGYAELTRRGGHELPKDVVHAIGRVESEAVRMTSLVDDLLLLARLDEGRELDRADVDLCALLKDAVEDARVAGSDHEWKLSVPSHPVVVQGDRARLQQVVANLLANARTHTPAKTRVTVALAEDVANDQAVLEVVDNGPGIEKALQESIFERFVRGDSSRSRTAGSTGLGLAIVSGVVEAHGGTTEVVSKPGRTVFRVRLPVR